MIVIELLIALALACLVTCLRLVALERRVEEAHAGVLEGG